MNLSQLFTTPSLAQLKLKEERNTRSWYGNLPAFVIAVLCCAVAALTWLLSLAPQDEQRPTPATKETPSTKSTPPVVSIHGSQGFGFNSSRLQIQPGSLVAQQLTACVSQPGLQDITVTGHTDCIGTDTANHRLSIQRALAVKTYLITLGAPAERIVAKGEGAQSAYADPLCTSPPAVAADTIARLEKYRRVDVTCEANDS